MSSSSFTKNITDFEKSTAPSDSDWILAHQMNKMFDLEKSKKLAGSDPEERIFKTPSKIDVLDKRVLQKTFAKVMWEVVNQEPGNRPVHKNQHNNQKVKFAKWLSSHHDTTL
jgi:hypothetical protein